MIATRLTQFDARLKAHGVTGFIIPKSDRHLGEYSPPDEERLAFLTGFDGSAGLAVVLGSKRAIFVDGRYTLQAKLQVDADNFEHCGFSAAHIQDWLGKHLEPSHILAYDPWVLSQDSLRPYQQVCTEKGARLVALDSNPIDEIWSDRPARPRSPAMVHGIEFAGKSWQEKWTDIKAAMSVQGASHLVLTLVDSINWLFNIRGCDIPHNPFSLSYALLAIDGPLRLFIDKEKCSSDVMRHLAGVEVCPYDDFAACLARLTAADKVWLDRKHTPALVASALAAAKVTTLSNPDPCLLLKACKNGTERDGARRSHQRDGVALTRFLQWLDTAVDSDLDEWAAAEQLSAFRKQGKHYQGASFQTISGFGPNGAVVHYRVSKDRAARITRDNLYLLDSGGQYFDGTTDVTRTMCLGQPTNEQRTHYTLVLKGHLALGDIQFPHGTSGHQLDALARQFLWTRGLDYAHGTGHGVGSFLAVHEGPQKISVAPVQQPLLEGMIVSNEPGFYLEGRYGIRIENLVLVIPGTTPGFLRFETLTMVPYARNLIDADLLSKHEASLVNRYHEQVYAQLCPDLASRDAAWLRAATLPLEIK